MCNIEKFNKSSLNNRRNGCKQKCQNTQRCLQMNQDPLLVTLQTKLLIEKQFIIKYITDIASKMLPVPMISPTAVEIFNSYIVSDTEKLDKLNGQRIALISKINPGDYAQLLRLLDKRIAVLEQSIENLNTYDNIFTSKQTVIQVIDNANTYNLLLSLQKLVADAYKIYLLGKANGSLISSPSINNSGVLKALVLIYMKKNNISKPSGTAITDDIDILLVDNEHLAIVQAVYAITFSLSTLLFLYEFDQTFLTNNGNWTEIQDSEDINGNGSTSDTAYAYQIMYDDYGLIKYLITEEQSNPAAFLSDATNLEESRYNMTYLIYAAARRVSDGDDSSTIILTGRILDLFNSI